MTTEVERIRQTWLMERQRYEGLALVVRKLLADRLRKSAIFCEISSRTKEVDSLVKKVLRKSYVNPYDDITDKAGVRAVVRLSTEVPIVCSVVRDSFHIVKEDNKIESLDPEAFGYLATHFEVRLRDEDVSNDQVDLAGLVCEVQIHTLCQNVWANLNHLLAYKIANDADNGDCNKHAIPAFGYSRV